MKYKMDIWKVVIAFVLILAAFLAFRSNFGITGNYAKLDVSFNSILGCDAKVNPIELKINASGSERIGEVEDVTQAIIKCPSDGITVCYLRNGTLYKGKPQAGDFVIIKVNAATLAKEHGLNEYYVCLKSNLKGGREIGKKFLSLSQGNLICSVKLSGDGYYGILTGYYNGGDLGEVYLFADPC